MMEFLSEDSNYELLLQPLPPSDEDSRRRHHQRDNVLSRHQAPPPTMEADTVVLPVSQIERAACVLVAFALIAGAKLSEPLDVLFIHESAIGARLQ
ncbi:hypothetical protein E2562_027481 [Oryza meyeriana var. granulata]|uniref:Uncharacterized protein n=1 Tax=Oryza meyeriana var. granulata TaxID=110450 RepID=A0A6G1E2B4_9ORYZ|nr:hypothetical protein E2562_015875 [Oryza meyeriana var. granulata]KAF0918930.1 hypothetical protein E2562_027481 [Oryza meyeriana var. granulata]